MKMLPPQALTLFTTLVLGTVLVAGCSESPQQKYDKATSHLNDVKKELKDAKEKVTDQQGEVSDAQDKLRDLQEKVSSQRDKVVQATQAVDKTVSDQVLFRTLQKELLDKDKFSDSAISVAVNNLTVTLSGSIPDQDTHDQAIKVTRDQPGVADVKDQLQIADQQADNNKAKQGNGGQSNTESSAPPDQGQSQNQDQSQDQDKKNSQKQGSSPSPANSGTSADSSGDTPPTDLPPPPSQDQGAGPQGPESGNGGDSAIPQDAPPAQSGAN